MSIKSRVTQAAELLSLEDATEANLSYSGFYSTLDLEQKTGLSTGCRQPLDRRDVNIERLGAVPYILSLVQLVELPGRPNCTSRFLATLELE